MIVPKENLKAKGDQLFKEQQYVMASAMYKKHIKAILKNNTEKQICNTDIDRAYHNLSLCFYKLDQNEKCVQACKEALKYNENYQKVHYRLALTYKKMKDEYNCMIACRDYCETIKRCGKSKQKQYKEMKELFFNKFDDLLAIKPQKVREKDEIMINGKEKKDKDKEAQQQMIEEEQIQNITERYSWEYVKNLVRENNRKQAQNVCYFLLNKNLSKNQRAKIKNMLKIIRQTPQSENIEGLLLELQQKSQNIIENEQLPQDNIPSQSQQIIPKAEIQNQRVQIQTKQPSQKQKVQQVDHLPKMSVDQLYKKNFEQPLNQCQDIFEGFYSVLIGLITNQTLISEIGKQNMINLLTKIPQSYPMFSLMKESLSKKQITEIKNKIGSILEEGDETKTKLLIMYCH